MTTIIKCDCPPLAGKKKKDHDAPKRPKGSFLLYVQRRRRKLAKAKPGLKAPQLVQELAKQLKLEEEELREYYKEQTEEAWNKYHRELFKYEKEKANGTWKKPKIPSPSTSSDEEDDYQWSD